MKELFEHSIQKERKKKHLPGGLVRYHHHMAPLSLPSEEAHHHHHNNPPLLHLIYWLKTNNPNLIFVKNIKTSPLNMMSSTLHGVILPPQTDHHESDLISQHMYEQHSQHCLLCLSK